MMPKKVIFIDRDGVINKDPAGWTPHSYVAKWGDFHFLPGAKRAIKKLNDNGYRVIVISNQAGVGKGIYTEEMLNEISARMAVEVEKEGGRIEKIYYCTHKLSDDCACRKPKTGLFEQAEKELGIQAAGNYFIGDNRMDIVAGKRKGIKTILVLSGKSSHDEVKGWDEKPDYISRDFQEAADFVIKEGKPTKTLILYATAGIGHKKAALAIKEAFDRKDIKGAVIDDVLNFTNNFFKFSYNAFYLFLIKYIPRVWGFFYYLFDKPFIYAMVRPARRLTNSLNSGNFVKFLLKEKPKTVISTHFFAPEVIADLKKRGLLKTQLISVITDYKSHMFWLSEHIDLYVVGSEYTKDDLVKRGVPAEKIKVFGIPCAAAFSKEHDAPRIFSETGLDPGKKTVFILGGGFGVGPIKDLVISLDTLREDFQGIVVCGYNKRLYTEVDNTARSARHKFRVYSFVDNIDELMAVSDVLVSKPGGITTTEALSAAVPMIIINPIPGQEMRNYRFLEKNKAALKINKPEEIAPLLKELFGSDRLETLKQNVRKIRLVDSGGRIADEINKR